MGSASPRIGPGSAVSSGLGWWRRVDLLVLSGTRLEHYRRRTDRPDRTWQLMGVLSDQASAPGELRVDRRGLRARIHRPDGTFTQRFQDGGWTPTDDQAWTPVASRTPPTPAELGLASQRVRAVVTVDADWPQALVDLDGSVYAYHRRPDGSWWRAQCVCLAPTAFAVAANSSTKVAQVTGERDATPTPWGERLPTLSSSRSTAGIRGTDLGVSVTHQGRRFLLFGDTHWTRPWLVLRDSIAEVLDDGARPEVRFHGSPLRLRGAGTTMGEYDVPLDAFSHGGRLYALFSSNHGRARQVMGRSVLARLRDPLVIDPTARRRPLRFDALATVSERWFINVSAQRRPAAEVPGCGEDGEVVLLWGTGAYRADEVRLAVLGADALTRLDEATAALPTGELGLRFWDGEGWADDEAAAAPLFTPGAYGELSVRWVPEAAKYALLVATGPGDAAGHAITLRWATHPGGPWTDPLQLLDWVATGMSVDPFTRFIKTGPDDPVAESLFAAQARGNGAAYAPYFFDARRDGDDLVLRYTLSTWNPYQVVLMEHRLVPGEF